MNNDLKNPLPNPPLIREGSKAPASASSPSPDKGRSGGVSSCAALPSGWIETTIGALVKKIVGGGTPSKANDQYFDGNFPFMTVKDMKSARPIDTVDKITEEAIRNSSTNIIERNTLIIATRMSLGKIVSVDFLVAINQDLKALYLPDSVFQNFFEYQYRHLAKHIESLGTGTTVKGIRLEKLKSVKFFGHDLDELKSELR